jgi:chromosome segregation ATPase
MGLDKLKKAGLVLLFAGNLIFFAAAYYFHYDHASLQEQLQELAASRDSALSEKVALQTEITLLQNRLNSRQSDARDSNQEVSNLERLLSSRDEELLQLRHQLANRSSGERNRNTDNAGSRRGAAEDRSRRGGGNMQERMERLKEENPEEYARVQSRMNEFQKRREEQTAQRELFFKNLDVSKLSSDQRRAVSEYQELLVASEEMANSIWQGGGQADFREMMEQRRAIGEMSENVRDILLQNLGNQVGVGGETLSANVQEILDMTSMGGPTGGPAGRFQGRAGRPQR